MPLATEKTFHGLKLIARCGGGAYGEVYCCEDISERRMAVKIVSKTRLGDAWKRELRGVVNYRRITENSPNLLQIFHVAEDEDHFYYTMEAADSVSEKEYVPDTLAHRLLSGPLPPDQLFPVLAGICNGIAAIHQAGFAHRDIKPDNILFVGGVPKLADIGLLSSLSNSMTALAGTLEFLPPEVRAADSPGTSDRDSRQRSDLYAFGKVVYCAATGLEPYSFPTVPTRLTLSRELKLFLNLAFKLCAKTPERRICDEETLARELELIEKTLGKTGKSNLPRTVESVNKFLLTPIPINRHVRDIFKWSCRHSVTIILFLSCVTCYWVLHRYYPELLQKERPPVRQTAETDIIPDSGPAKPVEPPPPRKVPEPVKKEISAMKAPVPVEKKPAASAVKPKTESATIPIAEVAKSGEKDAKPTVAKAKTTQTPPRSQKPPKIVYGKPKQKVAKAKTAPTKTDTSSTALLSWMLRNAPYREIAQERIAELKETEALRKAGKYDVSDDAGRAMEEKLWQDAAYSYQRKSPSVPYYLRRIEQIRETRKAFKSAAASSGGNNTTKAVVPELAFYIGWFKYQELRNSKRFGKLIAEHEAEVAAESKLRKSGGTAPEPGSDVILERKLWDKLNHLQSDEQIPYILEHIEYVREHRGKDPKPPKINAAEVKKLINEKLKCEMYIPRNWTIATPSGRDPADTSDADFSPDQLNESQKTAHRRIQYMGKFYPGSTIVYCDGDGEWRDTLLMHESELNGGTLFRTSGWAILANRKRTRFAGRCCVIDTSSKISERDLDAKLHDLQYAVYLIDNGSTCILFSLKAKKTTIRKRRKELEAALRTMKFYP